MTDDAAPPRVPALRTAAELARAAVRVVVPVECPVCLRPDRRLCVACRGVLGGPLRRCDAEAPEIDGAWPVWSLGRYSGAMRRVVLAWKTAGRADLGTELHGAMVRAGRAWARSSVRQWRDPLWVVPAPSGRARRRRGRPPVSVLADGLARGVASAGHEVHVAEVLRRAGSGQSGRGARERGRAARAGTRLVAPLPPGAPCLLVDDVVTTGATLGACRAVLEVGGARVLAAFVLASAGGGAGRTSSPSGAG